MGPVIASAIARGGAGIAGSGAGLTLWLIAELTASLMLAAGAAKAARELRDEPASTDLLAHAWPALGFFFTGGALAIASRLWIWTALGASSIAFFHSLGAQHLGGLSAAALAFVLTIALPLAFAVTLWTRAALARAAASEEKFTVALFETARALPSRFWRSVIAVAVPGLVAIVAGGALSGFSQLLGA